MLRRSTPQRLPSEAKVRRLFYSLNGCRFLVISPVFEFCILTADSYGASLQVNEGEPVYDFCWYPYMSVSGEWIASFVMSRWVALHCNLYSSGECKCVMLFCRSSHLCICQHES